MSRVQPAAARHELARRRRVTGSGPTRLSGRPRRFSHLPRLGSDTPARNFPGICAGRWASAAVNLSGAEGNAATKKEKKGVAFKCLYPSGMRDENYADAAYIPAAARGRRPVTRAERDSRGSRPRQLGKLLQKYIRVSLRYSPYVQLVISVKCLHDNIII